MTEEADLARAAALKLLARREHSARELEAKLRTRGHDRDTVDTVLAALTEEGLIDEARFAEAYVVARSRRGMGPVRLRAELRQRGVADAAIERALGAPEFDWPTLAQQVRQKKFGDALPRDLREQARQTRFLEYRGFDSEAIRAALGRRTFGSP